MEQQKNYEKYKVDDTYLRKYYEGMTSDEITEVAEMLKVATVREVFELIVGDCQKYISVLEHYTGENLQALCNIIIKRIEGHLLVKFRMDSCDRWVEVGFFDDNNDDRETLDSLKTMIQYHLKYYEEIVKQRRIHLACELDVREDPQFVETSISNKVNDEQHTHVDYHEIPEQESKLINVGQSCVDNLDNFKDELRKQFKILSKSGNRHINNILTENKDILLNYRKNEQIEQLIHRLYKLIPLMSGELSVPLYQIFVTILKEHNSDMLIDIIINIMSRLSGFNTLTDDQFKIMKKYEIDLGNL